MCDLNYFFRSPGEQDCWSFWHSWMLDYDTEAIVDSQKENNLFFLQICFGSKGKIWDCFVTSPSSPFLFPVSSKWAGENLSETLLKDSQGGALPSAAAGLGSTGHRGQTVERDYRERRTEGRRGGPGPRTSARLPGASAAPAAFPGSFLCHGPLPRRPVCWHVLHKPRLLCGLGLSTAFGPLQYGRCQLGSKELGHEGMMKIPW